MDRIERLLDIDLPEHQSAFLWGPRKTGKSTYLKRRFPESLYYDFLQGEIFIELSRRPHLLRKKLLASHGQELRQPVILDEIQKVPQVLDEVHWMIENSGIRFILCGSSARKLKRGRGNLLGGRAWRYEMFPLVSTELPDLDLLHLFNRGAVPVHYQNARYRKSLQSYIQDYLKEEVFAEGLARDVPAFSRFLEAMGYSHGELTNHAAIARDCGVSAKTVMEYYQILVDTLLATRVEPFKKRQSRKVITRMPKFYLFDVGVAGAITGRHITAERGEAFGRAFEHFIFMELNAHRSYRELDYPINFWKTKTGLEVDFVLGRGEVAIEVKGSSQIDKRDLRPLAAFVEEHSPRLALVVCNERAEWIHDGIRIVPYRTFLQRLWDGQIIG